MKKRKLIIIRIILILLIAAWMYIVFGFSAQEAESSSGLSHWVATFFTKDLAVQDIIEPIIRKIAHFSEYAFGGILFLGLFETFDFSEKKRISYAIIVGVLYAISDEIHQIFVPGRTGKVGDVWIDSLGVIVGVLVLKLVLDVIKKIKK